MQNFPNICIFHFKTKYYDAGNFLPLAALLILLYFYLRIYLGKKHVFPLCSSIFCSVHCFGVFILPDYSDCYPRLLERKFKYSLTRPSEYANHHFALAGSTGACIEIKSNSQGTSNLSIYRCVNVLRGVSEG